MPEEMKDQVKEEKAKKKEEELPKVIKEKKTDQYTLQVIKELGEDGKRQYRLFLSQVGENEPKIDEVPESRKVAVDKFRAIRKELNQALRAARAKAKEEKKAKKEKSE